MILLYALGLLYALWVLYVLVMGLYRARMTGRLSKAALVLGAPFLALGLVLDVLANITVASIIFAELPREWLVTFRLNRYLMQPTTWRGRWARKLCEKLLDPFDPTGRHCR